MTVRGTVPPVSSSLFPTDSVHRWSEFPCDQPIKGRLNQETRACGFVWRLEICHEARLCRAAPTTARRRWGLENDGLLGRKPAHAAERQLEAVPDDPEEQHVDARSSLIDCGDDHHSNKSAPGSFDSALLALFPLGRNVRSRRDPYPSTSSKYQ